MEAVAASGADGISSAVICPATVPHPLAILNRTLWYLRGAGELCEFLDVDGLVRHDDALRATAVFRVIYVNRNTTPNADAAQFATSIDHNLRESCSWNKKVDITGVLYTSYDHFAQVLEGPSDAVKSCLGHIACDVRHSHLRLLERRSDEERLFVDWSMAFVTSDHPQNIDLVAAASSGPRDESALAVLELLKWLVQNQSDCS